VRKGPRTSCGRCAAARTAPSWTTPGSRISPVCWTCRSGTRRSPDYGSSPGTNPLHPKYTKRASGREKTRGWRYQLITLNAATGQVAWLDARHRSRSHVHVEADIKQAKAIGLKRWPSIILSPGVDHGSEQGGCMVGGVLDVAAVGSESSGGMLSGEWVPGRVVAGDLVGAPVAEGSRQRVDRGADRGVTQEFLDGLQTRSAAQQPRRTRMSSVRTHRVRWGSCASGVRCAACGAAPPTSRLAPQSLRDGLRPTLTLEPLRPLSDSIKGRPRACPQRRAAHPGRTRQLSRENVPEVVWAEQDRGAPAQSADEVIDRRIAHRAPQRRSPQVDEDVVAVHRPVLPGEIVGIQAHQLRTDRDRARTLALDPSPVVVASRRDHHLLLGDREVKQTLGLTRPRLRTPEQADQWVWLLIGAYTQLHLARDLTEDLRHPWEQALPSDRLTPARVRRGFSRIRRATGVPANPPKLSRPGPGRPRGSISIPTARYPVGKNQSKKTCPDEAANNTG